MEKNLEKHLDESFRVPGVTGLLCTDKHGLCIGVKGTVKEECAGPVTVLARQAAALSSQKGSTPIICLESDAAQVVVKTEGDITLAVFKSK